MIECKLKLDALVNLTANLSNLTALSFSISSFADIKKDVFAPAKDTLANIKRLHIYYSSCEISVLVISYLGEHTTLIDYCYSLEELRVSSAGMAMPELCRPIISKPENHPNIRSMCITSNIHAGAQMLFYGTLSQLPNAQLDWETLLLPNVNFPAFSKKAEFLHCLKNVKDLKNLDLSGSKVKFPADVLDVTVATHLQHLNCSMTLLEDVQLRYIAANCNQLTSINLFGCSKILYTKVTFLHPSKLYALNQCWSIVLDGGPTL